MMNKTNLRILRYRHNLLLSDLAIATGLSNQYISRAELGHIAATPRLEAQLDIAIQTIIEGRKREAQRLEEDYARCKGRLFEPAEVGFDEQ